MSPHRDASAAHQRIKFPLSRWLLAPLTTRRARRLAAAYGPGMDARTAWALARTTTHPEEISFAMNHLSQDKEDDS
ncbi:hypothetical protein [Streptomyces sp. NPDC088246]|uniref:hypothetical protein n=1 Tax=Streptomyces sp. NPDC088246 TaxID=3365842 RepID=UPI0037F5A8D8